MFSFLQAFLFFFKNKCKRTCQETFYAKTPQWTVWGWILNTRWFPAFESKILVSSKPHDSNQAAELSLQPHFTGKHFNNLTATILLTNQCQGWKCWPNKWCKLLVFNQITAMTTLYSVKHLLIFKDTEFYTMPRKKNCKG